MKHEQIQREAYQIYLYRKRMNIKGTPEDDWINAIKKLNGT